MRHPGIDLARSLVVIVGHFDIIDRLHDLAVTAATADLIARAYSDPLNQRLRRRLSLGQAHQPA